MPIRFLLLVLAWLLLAAVAGCAGPGADRRSADDAETSIDANRDAELKRFEVRPGSASIYVFRDEFLGALLGLDVEIDGRAVGRTHYNTYVHAEVAPGRHTVTSRGENVATLAIDAEPGRAYFVWQEVTTGVLLIGSKLHLSTSERGRAAVVRAKLAGSTRDLAPSAALAAGGAPPPANRPPGNRPAGGAAAGSAAPTSNRPAVPAANLAAAPAATAPAAVAATEAARPAARPARRIRALVIGNGAYPAAPLANPLNDARAVAEKFRSFGFQVDLVIDADRRKMVDALSRLSDRRERYDVDILFYAGHGVQINGANYLVPVDLSLKGTASIELDAIPMTAVIDRYMSAPTRLVFLDACRDNPLARSLAGATRGGGGRGLARMDEVTTGTLISFATKDGSVAQDGAGRHSPYTDALLRHLDDRADIAIVLRRVRQRVADSTGGEQIPWDYGSLVGDELVLSPR